MCLLLLLLLKYSVRWAELAGQQKHLSTALSMNGPMAADDEAAGVAGVETLNRRFQAEMSRSVLELHDAATRTAAVKKKLVIPLSTF